MATHSSYFIFLGKNHRLISLDVHRGMIFELKSINQKDASHYKKNSKYIKRCPLLSTMTLKNCKAFQNQEKEKNKTPELTSSERKRKRFVRCHVFEQPTFEIVNRCTQKGVFRLCSLKFPLLKLCKHCIFYCLEMVLFSGSLS